jgi:hypothetical protein
MVRKFEITNYFQYNSIKNIIRNPVTSYLIGLVRKQFRTTVERGYNDYGNNELHL